ncbi:hypothetical protein SISSUDRAFT_1128878, partial [Sistotremastrum suecicum HHB10207 ss-3]
MRTGSDHSDSAQEVEGMLFGNGYQPRQNMNQRPSYVVPRPVQNQRVIAQHSRRTGGGGFRAAPVA